MATRDKLNTLADLRQMAESQPNTRFELVEGEILAVPNAFPLHNYILMRIAAFLFNFVEKFKLGYVFGDGQNYTLDDHNEFIPDVSFVSLARMPTLPAAIAFAPDLAVEVLSPSNSMTQMMARVKLYFQYGAQQVWLVTPETQIIDVWKQAPDGQLTLSTYLAHQTLDGGALFPGLALPVRDLFPPAAN